MNSRDVGSSKTGTAKLRKRFALAMAVLIAMGATAACGSAGGAGEESEHKFRLAYYQPPENAFIEFGVNEFIKEVEEKSDGRITFETFPNEQLGKAADSLEIMKSGVADMAAYTTIYHPEQLPLHQAFALPLGLTAPEMTNALWRAQQEDSVFSKELADAGVAPLMVMSTEGGELSSMDRPLPDLASAKGLRTRASSDIHAATLSAIGASPVIMPSTDIYTGLDRGTLDGLLYYFGSWKSISVQELLKHGTTNLDLAPTAGVNLGMSKSAWDKLSKEDQDLLTEAARVASINYMKKSTEIEEAALKEFEDAGLKTYEWAESDIEEMRRLVDPVTEKFFKDAEEKGYDAQAAQDELKKFEAEAVKDTLELPSY